MIPPGWKSPVPLANGPTASVSATGTVSRSLDDLNGKTIGEVYNNHFNGELMFETYRRLFRERYPGIRIIPFNEAERRLLIRIAVGSQRVRGGGIVSIRAFSECHLLFSFLKRA